MAQYLFVYYSGQPFDITKMPKDQVTQIMKAWGEWLGSMGSAVIDEGHPLAAGGKQVKTGKVDNGSPNAAGYSIIEAKDFDEALALAKTSPIVARGGSVEVYEAFGV